MALQLDEQLRRHRRSGAPRQRPAELSLTPPSPPTNSPSIEARVADPDFWKDQAAAQKLLQRRRRLEEDRDLSDVAAAPRRRSRACSSNGPRRASRSPMISAARSTSCSAGRRRRDQEDARRRARSQERHRHDPSRRRRHRVAGLGRDAAADVPALDRAPRLQARGHRPTSRATKPGIKSATLTITGDYAYGLLLGRSRRASARAHLAVRSGGAPPHLVRVGLRLARAARRRGHRDRGQGPPDRHVPLERRRRPARQRHRLRRPHHPPADRHRRVVPERAVAASRTATRR